MKFVFKKPKQGDTTEEVCVMDKRKDLLVTDPSDAGVEYEFKHLGGAWDNNSIRLNIEGQYFTAGDLAVFIDFLNAARKRLIKLDAKA